MLGRIGLWVCVLCVGLAGTLSGARAGSDDFSRVITFGDSLSDNGNLFALTGGTSPASPPYFNGRFSNGPVWIEQLFGPMNAPFRGTGVNGNVNVAFGGARADSDPNLLNPAIPGVPTQIAAFATTFGGTIGANDLVTVWAGANDIFQIFPPYGTPTLPQITASSIEAAGDQVENVQTLIGLGARTILVPNLPDLGASPAFNTSPTSQAGGSEASRAYNDALDSGLKALAAATPGVNIIQMDVAAAFRVILANPGAFGFTNVTQACLNTATGTVCANPNSYLFWDSVHPTQAGHALLALYASLLLNIDQTSQVVAPMAEAGLLSQMQASGQIFDRLTAWLTGSYAHQNGLYAEIVGVDGNFDAHGNRAAYGYQNYGIRAGIDRQFSNVLVGGALAILRGDLGTAGLNSDTQTVQGNLYAAAFMGPLFVNADVGYSRTQLNNIRRQTGFGPVIARGETQSQHYGGAVEAGLLLNFGAIAAMPSARIGYASSKMDGYTETADILAMSYGDRTVSASFWNAKLRISTGFSMGGMLTSAYVEGGWEDFISISNDNISAELVNNTALPVSVRVDDPVARGAFLKVGLNGRMGERAKIDIAYGVSFQNGDGETHTGKLRVKVPINWGGGDAALN